jgi:Holliday junction resolvase
MPNSPKGSRRERELLAYLVSKGFVVHRVAGSGLGEDAICDLVAVKDGEIQFIECKSRKKVYYTSANNEQLSQLIRISNSCKAKPVLAVKLNYKDWKIFDLNQGVPGKVS